MIKHKIEYSSYDYLITDLTNYLISFTNFLNLNDKRITKLEKEYNDLRQSIEKEVVN